MQKDKSIHLAFRLQNFSCLGVDFLHHPFSFSPACQLIPDFMLVFLFLKMEKENEDTREILLPDWQGSGSHGITIDQTDEGVFVKQVQQDSPAAKTGVVKEGQWKKSD